jgi:lipopolysaccharide export system ATP-binding protein
MRWLGSRNGFPVTTDGQLCATGLGKDYGGRRVLDDVSLTVGPAEIVGLLGPNGSGKTVTFSLLSGLVRPDRGSVTLNGRDITRTPMHERARRGLAYLPQERSVFRNLTALDNIAAVVEVQGASRRGAREAARRLLHTFGLARLADTDARRLSGGEQRRLEVARSMATHPRFLLSDEPFAGIDPLTIDMLRGLFIELRRSGLGILLTDHNVSETLSLCDRAYVLLDGHVLAHGTPAELAAHAEVRRYFLGDSFRLPQASISGNGSAARRVLVMDGARVSGIAPGG